MIPDDIDKMDNKELKSYIEDVLVENIPLDILHDETPTYHVFNLFKTRSDLKDKKRIKKIIKDLLIKHFITTQYLKLDKKTDDLLSKLTYLAETIPINKAYIILRSMLDRGLHPTTRKYFYSKSTEKKVLRALAVLQMPTGLFETVWKVYWGKRDPYFWDIAYTGLRKSNIQLSIESLDLAYKRWGHNEDSFDLSQGLYDLIENAQNRKVLNSIKNKISNFRISDLNILVDDLKRKGVNKDKLSIVYPDVDVYEVNDIKIDVKKNFYIYYHRDIDGIGSSLLLSYYLRGKFGFKRKNIKLISVDFDEINTWNSKALKQPCAILDFVYHKDTLMWFDHHRNSFINDKLQLHFTERLAKGQNQYLDWDIRTSSVTNLVFVKYKSFFKSQYGNIFNSLKTFVDGVSRIDSASYDDINDWFYATFNTAKINLMLEFNRTNKFCNDVIWKLYEGSCKKLLEDKEYAFLLKGCIKKRENDYKLAQRYIKVYENVNFYDSTVSKQLSYNRFFPYKKNIEAEFTVGIYKKEKIFEISVNINPWKKRLKEDGNIGLLCSFFGGGGHKDVGGIQAKDHSKALDIATKIINVLVNTPPSVKKDNLDKTFLKKDSNVPHMYNATG